MGIAAWLDGAFAGLDAALLGAVHQVQQSGADAALGPLARLLDRLGDGGLCLILLGLVLLCFRRTRRAGGCVLLALALGMLLTNLLLKPLVARPRPYTAEVFRGWWLAAGGHREADFSFPSGHTTAAAAAMTALFWSFDRRRSWTAFPFALAMGLSRLYLMVHYPTDVLAGLLAGFGAGTLAAWLIPRFRMFSGREDV